MNKAQQDIRLLPLHFKKVALGIMLLSILILVASIVFSESIKMDKDIIKTISNSGFLISLLLFAITRSKIEDELTLRIRLKAFTASFIWGVLFVIIKPFTHLLFRGSFLSDIGVTELLISMFFFYFMMMYLMKKNR